MERSDPGGLGEDPPIKGGLGVSPSIQDRTSRPAPEDSG